MQFRQLFALALIAIPSIALPDNPQDSTPDGGQFFVIAAAGSSQIDINGETASSSDTNETEQTTLQVGLGFQLNNQLNIELSRVNHSDVLSIFAINEHY